MSSGPASESGGQIGDSYHSATGFPRPLPPLPFLRLRPSSDHCLHLIGLGIILLLALILSNFIMSDGEESDDIFDFIPVSALLRQPFASADQEPLSLFAWLQFLAHLLTVLLGR